MENVRCFGSEPQTLNLSDAKGRPARATVLLGENGTGKTTLLQVLAGFQSIPYRPESSEDAYDVPRVVLYFQTETSMELLRTPFVDARVQTTVAAVNDLGTPAEGADVGVYRFLLQQHSIRTFRFPIAPPVCFGYGAARRLGKGSISEDALRDAAVTLFSDDAEVRSAEEWLLRVDYSASKPSPIRVRQKARLERVSSLLQHILPGVSGVRFSQPTEARPTPTVEFNTPYGWVPLKSLGYGYQAMVGWVVDLASRLVERYPESADPLGEPAVVLVDEIDLHLHPLWQRQVISHLTHCFPNTQFVVTAHSPLVVQGAGDANIAVLRREGDHVVIDNDFEAIRGWRVDQILTSELFNLPTARPPEFDERLARRRELLSKPKLTKADQRELAKLEAEIGVLPAGESSEEAQRMLNLAEESMAILKKYGG